MNLDKLFSTQKVLRDRIGYEGEDRFEKLILALLVEVGECANEWRGFKFWSKNQEPTKIHHTTQGADDKNAVFFKCSNGDECGEYLYHKDFENLFEPDYEECPKCREGHPYPFRKKNSMLEEYVDGFHFVLELGIELENVVTVIRNYDWQPVKATKEEITRQFAQVYLNASLLIEDDHYRDMQFSYLKLGEMLGFTWDEVEAAYFEKNKINHERQENGY